MLKNLNQKGPSLDHSVTEKIKLFFTQSFTRKVKKFPYFIIFIEMKNDKMLMLQDI